MAISIQESNFQKEVLESPVPVLVDFWAPWCGPCRMLSPVIEELSEEITGVKICKVNVDENQNLAAEYGISSIPSLILFKNGQAVQKLVGVQPKAKLEALLNGAKG